MGRAVSLAKRPSARRSGKRPARRRVGGPVFDFIAMQKALGKTDTRAQRIAYYLNWCASHVPLQYQPFNVIVQEINQRGRLPRMDDKDVVSVRSSMSTVRRILQKLYQRDLDVAGGGARATVNDEDAAGVVMPKKMRRLRSAKDAVLATNAIIDPSAIKDPRIKSYLNRSVKDVVKLIGSSDFDQKLLPPPGDEE